MNDPIQVPPTPQSLTIRAIETVSIRVPLARTYSGSQYQMTPPLDDDLPRPHRRGHRRRGLGRRRGRHTRHDQRRSSTTRSRRAARRGRVRDRARWELRAARDLRHPPRPAPRSRRLRVRRLGLWDAIGKALGQPLWRLWGGYRSALPMISIGGYYGGPEIEDEIGRAAASSAWQGSSSRSEGATRRPTRPASSAHARRRGADFILCADANQGWSPDEAIEFVRLVDGLTICTGSRSRAGGIPIGVALRDVRMKTGVRVCAGQSEYSAAGCRELMAGGSDRRLQLRCVLVRRADRVAAGGSHRDRATALRWDITRSLRWRAICVASIPHGTFVECFHPDRDPIWWNLPANRPDARRRGCCDCPTSPGSAGSSTPTSSTATA